LDHEQPEEFTMKFASTLVVAALFGMPTLALAQDSTNMPSTTPNTNCTVSGGCSSTGTGSQPNTTPDSTLEGGTSGSTSGSSGTLDNTGSGSTVDPGDSSGGGSSGGSNGAAGPLGNSSSD